MTIRKLCSFQTYSGINIHLFYKNTIESKIQKYKIQSISGQGQNFDFVHSLSIDRHYQMNKCGVVCFSRDRFNLAKIDKNSFRCW